MPSNYNNLSFNVDLPTISTSDDAHDRFFLTYFCKRIVDKSSIISDFGIIILSSCLNLLLLKSSHNNSNYNYININSRFRCFIKFSLSMRDFHYSSYCHNKRSKRSQCYAKQCSKGISKINRHKYGFLRTNEHPN